jgi:hypothetical protein
MIMKKGDIIYANKENAKHPIIFLEPEKEYDLFTGVMLTSSGEFSNNISMKPEHFVEYDPSGKKYLISYKNSCFVKAKFLKSTDWTPFKMAGKLTEEGIKFVESNVGTEPKKLWEEYEEEMNKLYLR